MDTWLLIKRHCNKCYSDVHWLHAGCQAAKTINLTWKNVETVRVNYYLMDVERRSCAKSPCHSAPNSL